MYSETAYNCSDGYIVATSGNEKIMVKTERHLGLWAQSASIRDKNNQHSVLLRNIKNSKKGQKRFCCYYIIGTNSYRVIQRRV